jgi:hypothetical protein
MPRFFALLLAFCDLVAMNIRRWLGWVRWVDASSGRWRERKRGKRRVGMHKIDVKGIAALKVGCSAIPNSLVIANTMPASCVAAWGSKEAT